MKIKILIFLTIISILGSTILHAKPPLIGDFNCALNKDLIINNKILMTPLMKIRFSGSGADALILRDGVNIERHLINLNFNQFREIIGESNFLWSFDLDLKSNSAKLLGIAQTVNFARGMNPQNFIYSCSH